MSTNTHPFGYKDYNDALHNGVRITLDEAKKLKTGDKVILLSTHDSDDNYSLENRLFEGTVQAFPDFIDVDGYSFEFNDPYFNDNDGGHILHPKDYYASSVDTDTSILNDVEIEDVKPIIIGEFKPKDKFLEFVGGSSYINFISNEATIEGKQLSGLDFDGITFKLTICDEGTVNFEEVGTNLTTKEQRSRLLELVSEKTIVPFRTRMCIRELQFTSVQTVKGKNIPLYLSVDYQNPYSKLQSLFEEEETQTEISEEQSSKLDALFSMFEDEITSDVEESVEETSFVTTEVPFQSTMESQFAEMKKAKVQELKNRLSDKEKELKKFEMDIIHSQKKVEDAKSEVKLLEDRLESLQPEEPSNGFIFNVSERLNEKIDLESDVEKKIRGVLSKVKSIKVDAFMKLFEVGEYQIRIGKKSESGDIEEFTDYESLPDEVKSSIKRMGIQLEIVDEESVKESIREAMVDNTVQTLKLPYKLVYRGDMGWGTIVQKMIKLGFSQESEFDKFCGSNSYKVTGKYDEEKMEDKNSKIKSFNEARVNADGSFSWDDNDSIEDWGEEDDEYYGDIKDDDFVFSIYVDEGATNEIGDPKVIFSISPLEYFRSEGACYDGHLEPLLKNKFPMIRELGDSFEEVEESTFDIFDKQTNCHWDVEQIIGFLCKAGLKPMVSYQKWCSDKDTQLYVDVINKLGHQNLIIK